MASNPMQRKSRISFLLGVIITLLISGVLVVFLLLTIKQKDEELEAQRVSRKKVYVLTQDVKAGQTITKNMLKQQAIQEDSIPLDATSVESVIDTWYLQTNDGESVKRDEKGLYLERSDSNAIIEVTKNENSEIIGNDGNVISKGDYYIDIEGEIKEVEPNGNVLTDEYGTYYIDSECKDKIRVYREENPLDGYYIYKMKTFVGDTVEEKRIKEELKVEQVSVLAKVDMNANTVITANLVVQSNESITDDVRQEEYNMITLPIDLMTNDYVDIRFKTPEGQNFIVVSKVQVDIPNNMDGTMVADTIRVKLSEDEILAMSSAIVEAYGLKGSEIYLTRYVDPVMQAAAVPTYIPNPAVSAQLNNNPNIVSIAMAALKERYANAALTSARTNYLQQYINATDPQEFKDNVVSGAEESIGKSINTRKTYLESLGVAY